MPGISRAQQSRQRSLAVEKWAIPQIIAVVLDQIERIEDRGPGGLKSAKLVETRQTVRSEHDRLAVEGEALGLYPFGGSRDRRQSHGPVVPITAVRPHSGTILADDHPVPVVFDLVDPIGTGRWS
jgi:hypothetical protein